VTAEVAVVCFALGDERFAVASADVVELDRANALAEPLAALCGLPAGTGAARTLTVAAGGWLRTFAVEAPVEVRTVGQAQAVPPPTGWRPPLVVGFARLDERWVQLLDSLALVALGRTPAEPSSPVQESP
jgi:chemotaxis signal transduction protein